MDLLHHQFIYCDSYRVYGGIIFVAPVRVYWKFIFCALTARDIIVNTRLFVG